MNPYFEANNKIKNIFQVIKRDLKSNIIRYITSALVAAIGSGVVFVWATGGAIVKLPGVVDALQNQVNEQSNFYVEQTQINRDQMHTNQKILESLVDIKQDLRDINSYLRSK